MPATGGTGLRSTGEQGGEKHMDYWGMGGSCGYLLKQPSWQKYGVGVGPAREWGVGAFSYKEDLNILIWKK